MHIPDWQHSSAWLADTKRSVRNKRAPLSAPKTSPSQVIATQAAGNHWNHWRETRTTRNNARSREEGWFHQTNATEWKSREEEHDMAANKDIQRTKQNTSIASKTTSTAASKLWCIVPQLHAFTRAQDSNILQPLRDTLGSNPKSHTKDMQLLKSAPQPLASHPKQRQNPTRTQSARGLCSASPHQHSQG